MFNRRHGDYAIVAAAATVDVAGGQGPGAAAGAGRCHAGAAAPARAGAGVVRPRARRCLDCRGGRGGAATRCRVEEDSRVTALYRRELTQTLVAGALGRALGATAGIANPWTSRASPSPSTASTSSSTPSRASCCRTRLREDCGLTGTHVGCEHGVCGACTVLVDGRPARACLTYAIQMEGHEITTIEVVGGHGALSPLQQALHETHGLQCGFCTPGIVMTVRGLPKEQPRSERGTDPRRAVGQPVPLHRLPEHRRGDPARGGADAGGDNRCLKNRSATSARTRRARKTSGC